MEKDFPIFRNYLEEEDDKPYFTVNSVAYYYEDMERKQKLIEELAKQIFGYDKKLNLNLSEIEQRVAERFNEWDQNLETLPANVTGLLEEWVKDGSITPLIDTTLLDKKAEKSDVFSLSGKVTTTERWKETMIQSVILENEGIDQSLKIQQAIEALPSGGTLKIPKGRWKANISIKKSNIKLIHEGGRDGSYLTPFNPDLDCVTIEGDSRNLEIDLHLIGSKNASHLGKGLVLNGVRNFWGRVVVDGFGGNNIDITPTTLSPNSYIYFDKLQTTGSRKSNLRISNGTSYTTAIYIDTIMNTVGGETLSNCIELDGVSLTIGLGWVEAGNKKGIKFYNNATLNCNGVNIDSHSSSDVLMENVSGMSDTPAITGNFTCDGLLEFTQQGFTIALRRPFFSTVTLFNPRLMGSIYIQNSVRNAPGAYDADDNYRIFRNNSDTYFINNGKIIRFSNSGELHNLKTRSFNLSAKPVLTSEDVGYQGFVTNTKRPAWWSGTSWVYADGTEVI